MNQKIMNILKSFNKNGCLIDLKTFTSGHINSTFYAKLKSNDSEKEYIIQRINKNVFKKPDEVMENISKVTNHIKNKLKAENIPSSRKVLKFYPSVDGKYYCKDENGDYWRVYKYICNSTTFDDSNNLKVIEETGKAFGEFQLLLDDFPINDLHIIIPHFHNTENRYKLFYKTLNEDFYGRAKEIEDIITKYISLESTATKMYKMQKAGQLSLRVTHNDTKCNNVLFDKDTNEKLCVIDLDTIMPGLIGFDFGDAIRFIANTSSEDEKDVEKVKLDLDKFTCFTKGFLTKVAPYLTKNELQTLSLGAITMTVECGLRFLTDYIDGDHYFKTSYPEHNLVRAKCQLALAEDMIRNQEKMQQIVNEVYNSSLDLNNHPPIVKLSNLNK